MKMSEMNKAKFEYSKPNCEFNKPNFPIKQ